MQYEQYVGIEYRAPEAIDAGGLHCYEFVELVLRNEFKLTPPAVRYCNTYKEAAPVFFSEIEKWTEVAVGKEQPGDVAVFRIGTFVCHCGVVIEDHQMLHCLRGRNSCLEDIYSPAWEKRLVGFYRWQT